MVDLTHLVQQRVDGAKVKDGVIILFVVGSTAGLTTIEYEPGLVNHDIAAACEILPQPTDIMSMKPRGTTTTATLMFAPRW